MKTSWRSMRFGGLALSIGVLLAVAEVSLNWLFGIHAYEALNPAQAADGGFWADFGTEEVVAVLGRIALSGAVFGAVGLLFGMMGEHRLRRTTRAALVATLAGLVVSLCATLVILEDCRDFRLEPDLALIYQLRHHSISPAADTALDWLVALWTTYGAALALVVSFPIAALSTSNDAPEPVRPRPPRRRMVAPRPAVQPPALQELSR